MELWVKRICSKGHHNKTLKDHPILGLYHTALRTKKVSLSGLKPKAFAMSKQAAARPNLLLAFEVFSSFQIRDICSLQPGTLDIHPFCTNRSIKLFSQYGH